MTSNLPEAQTGLELPILLHSGEAGVYRLILLYPTLEPSFKWRDNEAVVLKLEHDPELQKVVELEFLT